MGRPLSGRPLFLAFSEPNLTFCFPTSPSLLRSLKVGVMLKRTIPQLAVVFVLLASARIAAAQDLLPDLVRQIKPSVVSVLTYDAKGQPLISGTGFFVRPGEVVTNYYVIHGARRVEIYTLEGKGRTYVVDGVLKIDEENNLTLLKINLPIKQ